MCWLPGSAAWRHQAVNPTQVVGYPGRCMALPSMSMDAGHVCSLGSLSFLCVVHSISMVLALLSSCVGRSLPGWFGM
jgi:hypothetical protein